LQMAGMFLGYVIEALRDLPIAGICFMNWMWKEYKHLYTSFICVVRYFAK
jgi:hypothetical protein